MRTKVKHKVNVLSQKEYEKYIEDLIKDQKANIPDVKDAKKEYKFYTLFFIPPNLSDS